MTDKLIPHVPLIGDQAERDAALQRQWRNRARLSSVGDALERFLESAGFDRGPWGLSLDLENVTDEEHETRAFGSSSLIPAAPFSAALRVEWRF